MPLAEEIFNNGAIRPNDFSSHASQNINWYAAAMMLNRRLWELQRAVNSTTDQRIAQIDRLTKSLAYQDYDLNITKNELSQYRDGNYSLHARVTQAHQDIAKLQEDLKEAEQRVTRNHNGMMEQAADNTVLKEEMMKLEHALDSAINKNYALEERIAELESLLAIHNQVGDFNRKNRRGDA